MLILGFLGDSEILTEGIVFRVYGLYCTVLISLFIFFYFSIVKMDIDSKLNKLDINSGDEASSSTQVQVDSKVYYIILASKTLSLPFLYFFLFLMSKFVLPCTYSRKDSHFFFVFMMLLCSENLLAEPGFYFSHFPSCA